MIFTIRHNHPGKSFTRTAVTPSGVKKKYTFMSNLHTEVPDSMVPSLSRDLKSGHLFVAVKNRDGLHAKPDGHATNVLINALESGEFVRSKAKAKAKASKPAARATRKPAAKAKQTKAEAK